MPTAVTNACGRPLRASFQGKGEGVSDPLTSSALRAEIAQDLQALARRRRKLLSIFCLLGLGASIGLGVRLGLNAPNAGDWLWWISLVGFAAGGLTLCAVGYGVTFPRQKSLHPMVALGLMVVLALLWLMVGNPENPADFSAGAKCLRVGFLISGGVVLAALILGRQVLRRFAPTGLLIGVGAGMFGVIPIHFACADNSLHHLMVWHGLVPVTAGLFGALAWMFLAPSEE